MAINKRGSSRIDLDARRWERRGREGGVGVIAVVKRSLRALLSPLARVN